MKDAVYDHPQPVTCTCGHAFGHHDLSHPCLQCTRCDCGVYFTDWPRAKALGFEPKLTPTERAAARPYQGRKARSLKWPGVQERAKKESARTRWTAYRKD